MEQRPVWHFEFPLACVQNGGDIFLKVARLKKITPYQHCQQHSGCPQAVQAECQKRSSDWLQVACAA
jgi:hypothetical protein